MGAALRAGRLRRSRDLLLGRPPSRWTGPPPWLILVTVLGFLVAPMVSSADDGRPLVPELASKVQLSSSDNPRGLPKATPPPELRTARSGRDLLKKQRVGVVSMNAYIKLSDRAKVQDARALVSRKSVDIVGWQEATTSRPAFAALRARNWATRRFPNAKELAVSWRRSKFAFVGAKERRMAPGVDEVGGRYPFGDRFVVRVTLRHRTTGRLISVINTHLPRMIEDRDRPGTWARTRNAVRARLQLDRMTDVWERAPGRWVVGTGDYNVGARADATIRARGGLSRTYADHAVSSYQVLGRANVDVTHIPTQRYVDYVHAALGAVESGRIRFLDHRTFSGLNSDHRPLLTWFELS